MPRAGSERDDRYRPSPPFLLFPLTLSANKRPATPPCCHTPEETRRDERGEEGTGGRGAAPEGGPFDAQLHAGPVCAVSATTTMMALRITWFPLCPGENGRGMKGEREREREARSGAGGRGAKSGFKLRDNVVAPRRPQRAGWVQPPPAPNAIASSPSVRLPDSQPPGRTDGRTDHNVARRERQFTSRTDGRTRTAACRRRRRHLWAKGGRQRTHEHQVGGKREEEEGEGDQLRY